MRRPRYLYMPETREKKAHHFIEDKVLRLEAGKLGSIVVYEVDGDYFGSITRPPDGWGAILSVRGMTWQVPPENYPHSPRGLIGKLSAGGLKWLLERLVIAERRDEPIDR